MGRWGIGAARRTLLGVCLPAALLAGAPPLGDLLRLEPAGDAGIRFYAEADWERVEVVELPPASPRPELFPGLRWWLVEDGFRDRAEVRAAAWFGLEEIDLGDERVRARKTFGPRFHLTTFTGYQSSSQRAVRADYELGRGLFLRSEARERGESSVILSRETTFR